MAEQFSPGVEAFISDALAHGVFPSRDALLEQAVEALRREQDLPEVPHVHSEAVEHGLESLNAGRGTEWDVTKELAALRERHAGRSSAT
ncbi:MAG: hypothetical protein C0483_21895 [Pirellula sp.]|nr:hypothetical protein [Pirellula sp.]